MILNKFRKMGYIDLEVFDNVYLKVTGDFMKLIILLQNIYQYDIDLAITQLKNSIIK